MTLQQRVEQLVARYGSLRAAARALGINYGYLSRLGSGKKFKPSKAILNKLGITVRVTYELLNGEDRG